MEMDMVSKAFEQAFVSVSQKLLGLLQEYSVVLFPSL